MYEKRPHPIRLTPGNASGRMRIFFTPPRPTTPRVDVPVCAVGTLTGPSWAAAPNPCPPSQFFTFPYVSSNVPPAAPGFRYGRGTNETDPLPPLSQFIRFPFRAPDSATLSFRYGRGDVPPDPTPIASQFIRFPLNALNYVPLGAVGELRTPLYPGDAALVPQSRYTAFPFGTITPPASPVLRLRNAAYPYVEAQGVESSGYVSFKFEPTYSTIMYRYGQPVPAEPLAWNPSTYTRFPWQTLSVPANTTIPLRLGQLPLLDATAWVAAQFQRFPFFIQGTPASIVIPQRQGRWTAEDATPLVAGYFTPYPFWQAQTQLQSPYLVVRGDLRQMNFDGTDRTFAFHGVGRPFIMDKS